MAGSKSRPDPVAPRKGDDDCPPPPDLIAVARVLGAYGVRGWIRVEPFGEFRDSVLLATPRWWLVERSAQNPADAGEASMPAADGLERPAAERDRHRRVASQPTRCAVTGSRLHGRVIVAKPIGVDQREQAATLQGAIVLVGRSDFPPPGEGEYYWVDLIGCEVTSLEGVSLGPVVDVREFGADPVLVVVRAPGAEEILIPFVPAIARDVDLVGRAIRVDWQV